ncbi:hypothetical protein ACFL42_03640 [Candidatus Omnitrophota bacterium]
MRNFSAIIILLLCCAVTLAVAGCGKAEVFGKEVPGAEGASVGDIYKNSKAYNGKDVVIEGKITSECPTGCWFNVNDASGEIYVDLNPSGFAIPQKVGKKVSVSGKVVVKKGNPTIIGKEVSIK